MNRHRRGPPRRSSGSQQRRRVIRIHAEGERTEPEYLAIWGNLHRRSVTLKFGEYGQGSPSSLVGHACRDADMNRRAVKRGEPLYDEIWCVFDIDNHPNLSQAIDRANQKQGVKIAVSNPCFELWLVLHRRDQTAYIDRGGVQRLARDFGFIEGKSVRAAAFDELVDAFEDAKRRAKQLDAKHFGDGSPAGANPSTGVWRLVDAIRAASTGAA